MMKTTPYPFQEEDVRTVWEKMGGRAIIAWEPGLGKSLGSLYGADLYLKGGPVVVVCPRIAKETWRREAVKHFGMRATVLGGKTPEVSGLRWGDDRLYVINYDVLGLPGGATRSWCDALIELRPQLVISDECQYLKNRTAIRSKGFKALARIAPHVLGLSGTPLVNRPAELWSILNIIRPKLFPSFMDYALYFCAAKRTFFGWDFRGASNLGKLNWILTQGPGACLVRRRKADVLKELPAKVRSVVPLPLGAKAQAEYREALQNFLVWLAKQRKGKDTAGRVRRAAKAQELVQLGELKRLAARLKLPQVIEWVETFLETTEEKLLVFGVHHDVLRPLYRHFRGNAVLVDGAVTGEDRQRALDHFNHGKQCRLLFGNVDAAGVAWSCTATSSVLFAEMAWTPGQHTQAEDRCHGISRGKAGVGVCAYYAVARGTIEEDLCRILEEKQKVLSQVLDGGSGANDIDVMTLLLKATEAAGGSETTAKKAKKK